MEEEEERDGTTPYPQSHRTSNSFHDVTCCCLLILRLEFPGSCKGKTGADPTKLDSDYVDFLAKSFETQTWVYEQAVSPSSLFTSSLPLVRSH
jgi:hypothetical protein